MKLLALLLLLSNLALSSECIVRVDNILSRSNQDSIGLRVGDKVELQIEREVPIKNASFLGQLIGLDGKPQDYAFLDHINSTVHIFPEQKVNFTDLYNNPKSVQEIDPEKLVKTQQQEGGTCAAFAIFNCQRQMLYSGHKGNGKNAKELSSESERIKTIVKAVDDYYIDGNFRDAIEEMAERLGYKVGEISRSSTQKFKEGILNNAHKHPILIRFDVQKKMGKTLHSTIDHGSGETLSTKIWQPTASGEPSGGGHMILITGAVKGPTGKTYLVVQDANWHTIRLWDADLLDRLNSASLRAWTVYQP